MFTTVNQYTHPTGRCKRWFLSHWQLHPLRRSALALAPGSRAAPSRTAPCPWQLASYSAAPPNAPFVRSLRPQSIMWLRPSVAAALASFSSGVSSFHCVLRIFWISPMRSPVHQQPAGMERQQKRVSVAHIEKLVDLDAPRSPACVARCRRAGTSSAASWAAAWLNGAMVFGLQKLPPKRCGRLLTVSRRPLFETPQ